MNKFTTSSSSVRVATAVTGAALILGIAGCAAQTPKYDSQAGDALQRAKQAQTVLPTPAQRRAPAPATTSAEVQGAINNQVNGASTGLGGSSGSKGGSSSGSSVGTGGTSSK